MAHPFYGSLKLMVLLRREGFDIGRRHVRTLMGKMGIKALYRKPRLSVPGDGHRIYPYLLRDMTIDRPNQVGCTDITYIPLAKGFVYLVAVMDWHSRKVLACGYRTQWRPILHRCIGRGFRPTRHPSNLQHRSRESIHFIEIHPSAPG